MYIFMFLYILIQPVIPVEVSHWPGRAEGPFKHQKEWRMSTSAQRFTIKVQFRHKLHSKMDDQSKKNPLAFSSINEYV